jgi:hypothetical protein
VDFKIFKRGRPLVAELLAISQRFDIKPWQHPLAEAITLIARTTPNQCTPNLPHPPPNTLKHQPTCLSCPSIHQCLPDSHRHRRQQKYLCTCISEATPPPFSSCGGPTNRIFRSYARESAVDETAALEPSKSSHKQVSYCVFGLLHAAK